MNDRTERSVRLLRGFSGIVQVANDRNLVINEIHGALDTPLGALQRLPGKVPATTGGLDGPVWNVQQLRFQEGAVTLHHDGPSYHAQPEPPSLPGVIPFPPWMPPTSSPPQTQPPDWPDGSDIPTPQPPPPLPPYHQPTLDGYAFFYMNPEEILWNSNEGEGWDDPAYASLTKFVEDAFRIGGFCWIKVEWDPNVDWLSVRDDGLIKGSGFPVSNGDIVSQFWEDGSTPRWFQFSIDQAKVSMPYESVRVYFTAVSTFTNFGQEYIRNPDGSLVQTSILLTVIPLGVNDGSYFQVSGKRLVAYEEEFDLTVQAVTSGGLVMTDYVPAGPVFLTVTLNGTPATMVPVTISPSAFDLGRAVVSVKISTNALVGPTFRITATQGYKTGYYEGLIGTVVSSETKTASIYIFGQETDTTYANNTNVTDPAKLDGTYPWRLAIDDCYDYAVTAMVTDVNPRNLFAVGFGIWDQNVTYLQCHAHASNGYALATAGLVNKTLISYKVRMSKIVWGPNYNGFGATMKLGTDMTHYDRVLWHFKLQQVAPANGLACSVFTPDVTLRGDEIREQIADLGYVEIELPVGGINHKAPSWLLMRYELSYTPSDSAFFSVTNLLPASLSGIGSTIVSDYVSSFMSVIYGFST